MASEAWLKTDPGRSLVDEVVSTVVRRYRIDDTLAREIVEGAFSADENLRQTVEKETSPAKVMRMRVFKDAVAAIKRKVYYDLRRYSTDPDKQRNAVAELANLTGAPRAEIDRMALEIAQSHASTRERVGSRDEFYRGLLSSINHPETILDVGSGMQPLLFPFDSISEGLQSYLAVDKDPTAIEAINAYANACAETRLKAVNWNIRDGWEALLQSGSTEKFDVAFMFKLIPVVERQDPELLDILRETPAQLWVVTGSRISLTKRERIERRERAIITRFCDSADRHVVREFSIAEEFVLVVEK